MAVKKKSPEPTVRTLWGLAKSPELCLTGEELHMIVQVQTGKDSMRELTGKEIARVAYVLRAMKDSAKRGKKKDPSFHTNTKQLHKIHALERELGWDKDPKRLAGFIRRMFKVDSVEWLNFQQCSNLIEALKKMLERQEEKNEGLQTGTESQG